MAGIKLIERGWWAITNKSLEYKNDMIRELIHHIEMLEKKIEQVEKRNAKLERKYWEIKIKYEDDE